MDPNKMRPRRYYFSNRDLLIVAVLSGIGGVMSTYVGYLGNLLNRLLGVPFGAGQLVSGLHVLWFVLADGLVQQPGTASLAGLLKGVIELLTGSTHGVSIVLVSLVQGLVMDGVLLLLRRRHAVSYMAAAAIAASSNVFVFQTLYFSGAPFAYIILIGVLAFLSGLFLAGIFGYSLLQLLFAARPVRMSSNWGDPTKARFAGQPGAVRTWRLMVSALVLIMLAGGSVYYFAVVFESPWQPPRCRVEGAVANTLSFSLDDYADHEITISAELKGEVRHVPPRNYSGIPLHKILADAAPLAGADKLTVHGSDGYMVDFDLAAVLVDEELILVREEDSLRLVAGNYDGGHWVRMVSRMVVH